MLTLGAKQRLGEEVKRGLAVLTELVVLRAVTHVTTEDCLCWPLGEVVTEKTDNVQVCELQSWQCTAV